MKDYKDLITGRDGNPIRILMVGKHTCIRVIRYARALKSVGYEVDLLTNKISYGTEVFDRVGFWHNEKQFKTHLYEFKNAYDIINCHNEPDTMTFWIREVIGKKSKTKLINDFHDLDNIRRGYIPIEERKAFNSADAVIYVSEPIQEICNKLHSVKVPTMVMYNYPTQSMLDTVKIDWDKVPSKKKTLVYEGGVNPIGTSDDIRYMNEIFKYRNLFPIFKALVELGNEVHVIPGNIDAYYTGQHVGAVVYPPMEFDKLLQKMAEYKYNLLIFNNKDCAQDQVNYTTPNKLWDGLCAGLPSIACWCKETENYVKKHGIGWTFNSLEEIGDCSQLEPEYLNIIENVKVKRNELIFERQIVLFENLCAQLLKVDKKTAPDDIKQQLIFEYGKKSTLKLLK